MFVNLRVVDGSLSARRAWIEISVKDLNAHLYYVALRKESVDRNCRNRFCPTCQWVALRKESVDRNGCNRKNWVIYV